MQIICPNCATFYQLADAAIGTNGRSVRCVRCQTVWHAAPPAMAVDAGSAGPDAADESVAAFRDALGGAPLPPEPAQASTASDPTPTEPSLDDLTGSNA